MTFHDVSLSIIINYNNNNNKSQIILAKQECSTRWGNCKSNQMLVFEERGKPGKNLSEQSREATNSAHDDEECGNQTQDTLVEGECSHHCANPAPL